MNPIRFLLELAAALAFFAMALSSWLVEVIRCVLLFIVIVPVLIARVAMAAIDVAIERLVDYLIAIIRFITRKPQP